MIFSFLAKNGLEWNALFFTSKLVTLMQMRNDSATNLNMFMLVLLMFLEKTHFKIHA